MRGGGSLGMWLTWNLGDVLLLSPVCSKPDMVSTPLAPFLLTLPGTTFSDRVYWTGGEKYGSNGGGNLWSWKFVSYMYVPSK